VKYVDVTLSNGALLRHIPDYRITTKDVKTQLELLRQHGALYTGDTTADIISVANGEISFNIDTVHDLHAALTLDANTCELELTAGCHVSFYWLLTSWQPPSVGYVDGCVVRTRMQAEIISFRELFSRGSGGDGVEGADGERGIKEGVSGEDIRAESE